jgi:hypothetical protein
MKPSRFAYHAPETISEGVALLQEHGDDAKPLAGGQSLVPLMNLRLAAPSVLVDLNRIGELAYVFDDGVELVLGSTAGTDPFRHGGCRGDQGPRHPPFHAVPLPWRVAGRRSVSPARSSRYVRARSR